MLKKQNRQLKKLVSTFLVVSTVLTMTGCKRNSASEKQGGTQVAARDRKEVVAESDPYFYITEKELTIPVEKNRKVVYADLGDSTKQKESRKAFSEECFSIRRGSFLWIYLPRRSRTNGS